MEIRFLSPRLKTILNSEFGIPVPKSAIYVEVETGLLLDFRLRHMSDVIGISSYSLGNLIPTHIASDKLIEVLLKNPPSNIESYQEVLLGMLTRVTVIIESIYRKYKLLTDNFESKLEKVYSTYRDKLVDCVTSDYNEKLKYSVIFKKLTLPVAERLLGTRETVIRKLYNFITRK